MAGNFSKTDGFAHVLTEFSDARLEDPARDYMWLAEIRPFLRYHRRRGGYFKASFT
jgi:hypothetical protein